MPSLSPSSQRAPSATAARSHPSTLQRWVGFVPLVLAVIVTLVLGGASVARAVALPPLDAHTDLEFSLDGSTWSDAPDEVLGSWGCEVVGDPVIPDPAGAIGGTPGADPCSMSPGESIDRTYYVRNATTSGRTGMYSVGIGNYEVSDEAEFDVSSTITGVGSGVAAAAAADGSGTVTLYGAATDQAALSPERGSTVATMALAPGASARVVDEVSVPADPFTYEQYQSVSPRIWVSFTEVDLVDTDKDGLPDVVEEELGTPPLDPLNPMVEGTVGDTYGPVPFLPVTPDGTVLDVDLSTLPPGLRLEDGNLVGTPTSEGVYDVAFEVTMSNGATYTSIRRVIVHAESTGGGGSSDLPGFIWPVIVIGVIIWILGPDFGSLSGSSDSGDGSSGFGDGSSGSSGSSDGLGSIVGGSLGSVVGGSTGGSANSSGSSGNSDSSGSSGSSLVGSVSDWFDGVSGSLEGLLGSSGSASTDDSSDSAASTDPTDDPAPTTTAPQPVTDDPARPDQPDQPDRTITSDTDRIPAERISSREGAPSESWTRANSEVRSSLASTGVGATDLLLWALTAAAAGVTLVLVARRLESGTDED